MNCIKWVSEKEVKELGNKAPERERGKQWKSI